MKLNKIIKRAIALSFIMVSIVYAAKLAQSNHVLPKYMNTAELQVEVEIRSQNGNLPFEMGQELIKRWTDQTKRDQNTLNKKAN